MNKPKSPQVLRDVDRILIHQVHFQAGILPMEKTDLDMRRALQQLPPDEARQLKRKFRKLWRRAMQETLVAGGQPATRSQSNQEDAAKRRLGVGKQVPSRAERNARKQLVFNQLWASVIAPLIKRFENPENPRQGTEEVSLRDKKTKNA
jgi:hypothetical protein